MKLTVDLFEPGLVDMRVDLRCRETRVAEHLLDGAKIRAVTEQMRRKRVPQKVRPDALLESGELGHAMDDLPDPGGGETPAMIADKNFASRLRLDEIWAATGKPEVKRGDGFFTDGYDALAVPLAEHAEKFFFAEIILEAKSDDFRGAKSAGIEDFELSMSGRRRLRRGKSSAEERSCSMRFSRLR
jgi:hypothetical protein